MSEVQALQTTLALEHEVVQLLGVLGGQTSQEQEPERYALISARHAVHRGRRDDVVTSLRARGAEPVAAAAAYPLPPVDSSSQVAAAGLQVERRCAEAYAALVAESDGALRGWAISALGDSALVELSWGAAPESFPGAAEL